MPKTQWMNKVKRNSDHPCLKSTSLTTIGKKRYLQAECHDTTIIGCGGRRTTCHPLKCRAENGRYVPYDCTCTEPFGIYSLPLYNSIQW